MALALYRKYRPRTFAEVIGQEHVTEPLSQALRSGRLNHAYLFSGPRGCGKTSSARILARSLNCEQGPTPEPCGQCGSCRSLATDGGGSIDVIEIDAASHGGVDDARELREKAFFAPASSRFKIYVIDEAHMVSSAGFNALLKLVEEPPEYVKFIFATTEPEKVLGTIKSRTHHYPFRLIPPKVLRPYLEQLTEAEGVQVEPAVFPLVVRAGGGSARDSLSVLDQLIAGAGPEGVTYARAAALLGVTDSALIDEMCDALAAGDGAAAYATVDRVAEAGHDARRFASDLLERLRDLIVLQQVPDAAAKGLIDGPADQIERMAAQAQRLGPGTLSRCADIVHDGLVEMRGTTAPRLLLELICARMLLPGARRLDGRPAPAPGTDGAPAHPRRHRRAAGRRRARARRPPPGGTPRASRPARGCRRDPGRDRRHAGGCRCRRRGVRRRRGTRPLPRLPVAPPRRPPRASSPRRPRPAPRRPARPARRVALPAVPYRPRPSCRTRRPPRRHDPGAGAPGALDAVAVRRAWPEVVGKVNRTNKRIAALMRDAVVRDLDGDTLVVTVKSSVLAKMMADHAPVLTDALYEELGGRWQIRCEVAGERGGASLPGPGRQAAPSRPAPVQPTSGGPSGPAGGNPSGPPAGPAGPSGGATRPAPVGGAGNGDSGGWPEPARPGDAGADDDWPEPARPGGPAPAAAGESADWPEAARPGGATATATASAPAVPKPAGPSVTPPAASPVAPVSSAIAAARAAAAAAGTGAAKGPRTTQADRKTADAEWAGEPPYDPDYDGPVRGGGGRPGGAQPAAPAYEGFDPGDEPLDEVIDERTARQSSEEQAVQLLREAFGAEKINEVDAR